MHAKGGSEETSGAAMEVAPGCTAIDTGSRFSAAHNDSRIDENKCEGGREDEDDHRCAKLQPEDVIGCPRRCLSCSDKISRWSTCGVQGALLSHFLDGPIFLASVVVGRKFAEPRCALALGVSCECSPSAHSMVVCGTSVRLEHCKGGDAGERGHASTAGGRGTQGDGDECLSWAEGDKLVGRHDGRTGCALSPVGGRSNICRAELFAVFARTCAKCSTGRGSWLRLDLDLIDEETQRTLQTSASFSSTLAQPPGVPVAGGAKAAKGGSGVGDGGSVEVLTMASYHVVKRAAHWYRIARGQWMAQHGLQPPPG
jgi:hypothetical protein